MHSGFGERSGPGVARQRKNELTVGLLVGADAGEEIVVAEELEAYDYVKLRSSIGY